MARIYKHIYAFFYLISSLSLFVLTSCGGQNSESNANIDFPNSTPEKLIDITSDRPAKSLDQAIFIPLVNANIELIAIDSLTSLPIFTTTSASDNLELAGRFTIPMNYIEDEKIYLIRATGGQNIDVNDDGIADDTPTSNNGAIHAIVRGTRIKKGNFQVSIVSEVMYQRLYYFLIANYSQKNIQDEINNRARIIFINDIDGDGDRDIDDIASWHPRYDQLALRHGVNPYRKLMRDILAGQINRTDALQLTEQTLATISTGDIPSNIAILNNVAYVASNYAGFKAIDISNPLQPLLLDTLLIPIELVVMSAPQPNLTAPQVSGFATARINHVSITGNIAFITVIFQDGSSVLYLVNIQDPKKMRILGWIDTPGNGTKVVVDGNFAYVADRNAGVQIIDITDPSRPMVLSNLNMPGSALDIAIINGVAYVADGTAGVQVFDINPTRRGTLIASFSSLAGIENLTVSGNRLFAIGNQEWLIIDITDSQKPQLLSRSNASASASKAFAFGNIVCISTLMYGIQVFDVTNPAKIRKVSTFDLPSDVLDIQLDEKFVYEVTGNGTFRITSLNSLSRAPFIGNLMLTPKSSLASIVDATAYVANLTGVDVIDISNVESPRKTALLDISETTQLHVKGKHLYGTSNQSPLLIYEISDPSKPTLISTLSPPLAGTPSGLAVADNVIYSLNSKIGLQVFDATNPALPILLKTVSMPSKSTSMIINGNTAYIASLYKGLQIIDISNAETAYINNVYAHKNEIVGMALQSNVLAIFMADKLITHNRRLLLLDVSNPLEPTFISELVLPNVGDVAIDENHKIAFSQGYIYIADGIYGVRIIDVSDYLNPTLIGTIQTPSIAKAVTFANGNVFVLDSVAGLLIMKGILQKAL